MARRKPISRLIGASPIVDGEVRSTGVISTGEASGSIGTFDINNSLRFDGSGDYLVDNLTTTGNLKTFTYSCWVKRSTDDRYDYLFTSTTGTSTEATLRIGYGSGGTDNILCFFQWSGSFAWQIKTTSTITDNEWHHVVLSVDTRESTTDTDKVKIYLDGVLTTHDGASTYMSTDADTNVNLSGNDHGVGGEGSWGSMDGQLAEVHFIDGTAYDASYFGETLDGVWVPKEVTGLTYGNNGFYLDFAQPSSTINAFNAVTYTGTRGEQAVTGLGFQPDFVWLKVRTTTYVHGLFDTVRGGGNHLMSNLTNAEISQDPNGYLSTFDTDGFTLIEKPTNTGVAQTWNETSENYIAWAWKAGGAPTATNSGGQTPTSGSVMIDGVASTAQLPTASIYPTKMSVNTEAGFSIIKYTGNGSTASIPHGLNSTPECVIVKNLDTAPSSWAVWHDGYGANNFQTLYLDEAYNLATLNRTRISAVSNQTLSLANHLEVTGNADEHIAYCWHSVEGYSKIGSYVGGGSNNVKVKTGFRPAFVLIKNVDSTPTAWGMFDNARDFANGVDKTLYANVANTEDSGTDYLQFDADGFTVINSSNFVNQSGNDFIYMAFADTSPNLGVDTTTDGTGVTLLLDGSSTTNDTSSSNIASNLVADANITATNTSSLSNVSAPYGAGPVNVLDFPSDQTTGISHTSSSIPELLDPTETQWTIELWVRPESFATYDYLIAQASDGATGWSNGLEWILDWDTSNIYFVGYNGSGGNTSLLQASLSTYGITVDNWHHIAVVRDGSDTMLFLNGQKAATITNQNIVRTAGNRNLFIGTDPTDNYAFHGQMTDIRITRGIARYTDSFTPPTSALSADVSDITGSDDVTLFLDGSSPTNDISSNDQDTSLTFNGTAFSASTLTGPGSQGTRDVIDLNGTDQYITSSYYNSDLWNQDFTVEGWFYLDTNSGTQGFFAHRSSTAVKYGVEVYISGGGTYYGFVVGDGSNWLINTTGGTPSIGWHHIALTRNGNTFTLFVDGVSTATGSTSTAVVANGNFIIGNGESTSANQQFNGKFMDFRITEGAALYPFRPPISALTNDDTWDKPKNNFSVEGNITADDQLLDTPNLRFASLDASDLSDANLTTRNIGDANTGVRANSYGQKSSGKWYWETCLVDAAPSGNHTGVWDISETMGTKYIGQTSGSWGLYLGIGGTAPRVRHNGTYTEPVSATEPSGVTAFASGDIVSIAIDLDSGKMWYGKNDVWFGSGNPSAGTNDAYDVATNPTKALTGTLAPADIQRDTMTYNFGQDHTFAGAKPALLTPYSDANGNGEFYYQPPSGFLALAEIDKAKINTVQRWNGLIGNSVARRTTGGKVIEHSGIITTSEAYQSKL